MIRTADAIEASLDDLEQDDMDRLARLIDDHLPPILVETAGERLMTVTPAPYLRWIMAKSLAAHMVYREGYSSLESIPDDNIATLALDYLRLEQDRICLASEVEATSAEHRDRIAAILRQAGILSSMGRSPSEEN